MFSQALPSPARDIGMMGVMIHVIGDAINNLGIIVASLFIWFMSSESKYYADPAVSVGISLMIFMTALPLVKTSGVILLQSSPQGMNLADVKHDLEKVRTFCHRAENPERRLSACLPRRGPGNGTLPSNQQPAG